MNKRVYITTSIPYVNGRPHVGHALELVQADAIARYHRLLGREVRFQTGADENAFKNVATAKDEGLTPQQLVDRNTQWFVDLCEAFGSSHDHFIRTTSEEHIATVNWFWKRLKPGDTYTKRYAGLYCNGCEDFYLERDLVNGLCPDHKKAPVPVKEENLFFRLSSYQDRLEKLIRDDVIEVVPRTRKNEVLSFIRRGLHDISISRSSARSDGWGIPVPGNPSQVIYVWIDALINYVSGLGLGTGDAEARFWAEDTFKIHVIGKNVWKFHAVYWPALLLSAGLPLPNRIIVHGFLTENGEKISKSRGFAIDPIECVQKYGLDTVRYYLLRGIPTAADGDFSTTRIEDLYATDLANGLGNLVSRLTTLCDRAGYGSRVAPVDSQPFPGVCKAVDDCRLDEGLQLIWREIAGINQAVDAAEPWKALKSGRPDTIHDALHDWVCGLLKIAYCLEPFLPNAGHQVRVQLRASRIRKSQPLFPRRQPRPPL